MIKMKNKQIYLSSAYKHPFKFYDKYIGKLKWWQKIITRLDVLFHKQKQYIILTDTVDEIKTIKFKNGSVIFIIPKDNNDINGNIRGRRSKEIEIL